MLRTLRRVFSYARPYIAFFILTVIFAAAGISLSLAVPVFIGEAVDCCVGAGNVDFDKLLRVVIKLGASVAVSGLFQWLMSLCTNRLAFLTVRDIRADAFAKLQRVPLRYIDRHTKGELTSRVINDIEIVSDGLLQGFIYLILGKLSLFGRIYKAHAQVA